MPLTMTRSLSADGLSPPPLKLTTRQEEVDAIREVCRRLDAAHAAEAERILNQLPKDPKEQARAAWGALHLLISHEVHCRRDRLFFGLLRRQSKKLFRDNVIVRCVMCGSEIEQRPHRPLGALKVCAFCALRRVRLDA